MDRLYRERFAKLVNTICFSLLLAFSTGALAQEMPADSADTASVEVEKININKADAATIARVLDGIGMTRAQAIVTYREEIGEFADVDELMLVNGVGEVTIRNNEDRIDFD